MRLKSFHEWLQENMGSGPYIGNCQPTDDYQVFGACSDQNTEKKNAIIRKGQEPDRKKKKIDTSFKEFAQNQDMMAQMPQDQMSLNPAAGQSMLPQQKKWKATKEQIISYWRGLRDDVPIAIKPISYEHKGSTYGEDGIRLTGSPDFIGSMLPRLKELLAYETPSTKLALVYRETESPSKTAIGGGKTSYVFYLQVKERGQNSAK